MGLETVYPDEAYLCSRSLSMLIVVTSDSSSTKYCHCTLDSTLGLFMYLFIASRMFFAIKLPSLGKPVSYTRYISVIYIHNTYTQGPTNFSKNLGAISKFKELKGWHEASSILRNSNFGVMCKPHSYLALSARLCGVVHLCVCVCVCVWMIENVRYARCVLCSFPWWCAFNSRSSVVYNRYTNNAVIQPIHDLRRRSVPTRVPGLRVRMPPVSWMSVYCEFCVVSGKGLCDGPIPRAVCCVWVWSLNLKSEAI